MPTSKVYAHINMNALAPFLLFGRGLSDVGSVILHLDFLSAARGARRTRRAVRSAGFRPAVEWRRGLARGVGVVLGEGAAAAHSQQKFFLRYTTSSDMKWSIAYFSHVALRGGCLS